MNLNKAKVLTVLVHQLEGLEQLADILEAAIAQLETEFTLPRDIKENLMNCISAKWNEIVGKIEEF